MVMAEGWLIVILVEEEQPSASVTVYVLTPAAAPLKVPVPVSVPVPPEAITVTLVVPPLQLMDPAVADTEIAGDVLVGLFMVAEAVAEHRLASLTVTEYDPGASPEMLLVVAPLFQA